MLTKKLDKQFQTISIDNYIKITCELWKSFKQPCVCVQ